MSMISAQIDELRELAGDGSMEWVAGPIRASVLRDAADTIWQLRDDLQRANAENAKLRDENAKLGMRIMSLESALEGMHLIREQDKAENTKLRELAVDAHACKENDGCCEDCYADEGDCPIELRMRELRIELGE